MKVTSSFITLSFFAIFAFNNVDAIAKDKITDGRGRTIVIESHENWERVVEGFKFILFDAVAASVFQDLDLKIESYETTIRIPSKSLEYSAMVEQKKSDFLTCEKITPMQNKDLLTVNYSCYLTLDAKGVPHKSEF